jgi:NAD(P)-dependent dehydrogenase (short-subunit alcohol dehydrogenase family)
MRRTAVAWTADDLPDQSGRTIIVTGANSGLGEATAGQLAARGARVVLACRNTEKGAAAARRMAGDVTVRRLDLADLASVRAFADGSDGADVLVNNAGVMAIPEKRTADGFEMQIGTNFLGHFALTLLLLPALTDRVVTISSPAHRIGRIDLADLNWEHRTYRRWAAYGQSKLADLMFAFELDRRLSADGSAVRSVAAHPGYAATELQFHTEALEHRVMGLGNRLFAQSADDGARPALYAATMPDVRGGDYWGPDGLGEMRGHPKRAGAAKRARDEAVARRLWDLAAQLTGVALR